MVEIFAVLEGGVDASDGVYLQTAVMYTSAFFDVVGWMEVPKDCGRKVVCTMKCGCASQTAGISRDVQQPSISVRVVGEIGDQKVVAFQARDGAE